MSSSASAIFTGSSQFSADLQNVVSRAVSIASLPLTQLANDLSALQKQSTALNTLDSKFASLQSAIAGLDQAVSGSQPLVASSDSTTATASATAEAAEGTYSVEVSDIGAYSTSLTKAAWDSTGSHSFKLKLGSTLYDLSPADNTAAGVAAAVNSKFGDRVRAVVVNVGSSDAADYRISLQSAKLGSAEVDIQDSGASLQNQTPGHLAQFIVAGSGKTATSDSRSIAVAKGLTVSLLKSNPGKPVEITVSHSSSALSGALTVFTGAYNSAVDAISQQTGSAGGALAGDSLVSNLQQLLSGLSTYSLSGAGSGGVADLGLSLGKDGKLTFDSTASGLSDANSVASLLGSAKGGGFLKFATDAMTGVEDKDTGVLKAAENSIQAQIKDTNNRITDKQDAVSLLQDQLNSQMAAADAAISAMEQQYGYLSGMFQAMQTADQQYK